MVENVGLMAYNVKSNTCQVAKKQQSTYHSRC